MKVIVNSLIFYILFSVFSSPLFSEEAKSNNPQYIFYKANSFYEQGKYGEAIKEYERLLDLGLESGNLYYNLGNAYFKSGSIGKAVLNYERANRLIPRDSDLKSNYDYSKSLIEGETAEMPRLWILEVLYRLANYFTIDGLTLFIFYGYVFVVLVVIAGLFLKPLKRFSRYFIFSTLFILTIGLSALLARIATEGREGVVIAQNSEVRFEPFARATVYFTLYEGMKIAITKERDDWYRIRRPDGKIGWVEKQDMEKI